MTEALAAVGLGTSYTDASARVRARTGRSGSWGGQLVANWVQTYTPIVSAEHQESEWPETLVLDDTWFMDRGASTGVAFNVLAAFGYPRGSKRGRLWAPYPPTDDARPTGKSSSVDSTRS